jgi:hypothetical protein
MGATRQTYPRGIVTLDGSTRAFARLDPYQQRRLHLLAARGVQEAAIDDHGNAHAIMPNGRRVTIRRPTRVYAQAFWGLTLAVWIQLLTTAHMTPIGAGVAVAATVLVHHAWPRVVPRQSTRKGHDSR